MKIKDIQVHFVHALWRNFVIVRTETDDGIIGYGEGTMGDFEKTIEAAILDYRPHLIGREIEIPSIMNFLSRGFFWRGGPILMTAISAIEQSLWDILGKSMNKPVYALLGGKAVERIKVYANGFISGSAPPNEYGAASAKQVENGFNAVKIDPFGGAGPAITPGELDKAVARVKAIRDAVGPEVGILVEAEGRFDPSTAIKAARAIERFDPLWIEEPIPEEDLDAMAYVRSRSPVPVATGERVVTKQRYAELLSKRAADIIQADVCHVGGIRALCTIGSMAENNYIPVAPHNPNGPIATAASLNAMMAMPNSMILEFWLDVETVRHDLITDYFEIEKGYLRPSGLPGLGIEVNEKALSKYPYKKLHVDYYSDDYKYHGDLP
ncbi:MAG: mandelate racemase/muconate lactonizing enzyme family protein [Thaumarchaeota archaeon]|nr:mandelate racemase/muconate lactonizing enzyme family protein [Nitrososphaerota archaeon]